MKISLTNSFKNTHANTKKAIFFQKKQTTIQKRYDTGNNLDPYYTKSSFEKDSFLDNEYKKWRREKNIIRKTYESYHKTVNEYKKHNPEYINKLRNLTLVITSTEITATDNKIPEMLIKQNALLFDKNGNPKYQFAVLYSFDGEVKNSTLNLIL